MAEQIEVTVVTPNDRQKFSLRKGLGFQALAEKHQTRLEFDCREADCGICIMKVLEGQEHLSPKTPLEQDFLKAMRADPDERLACQCRINGDVTIFLDDP